MTCLLLRLGTALMAAWYARALQHPTHHEWRKLADVGIAVFAEVVRCHQEGCHCGYKTYVFPKAVARQSDKRRFL